jgi:hypothetical protein
LSCAAWALVVSYWSFGEGILGVFSVFLSGLGTEMRDVGENENVKGGNYGYLYFT